MRYLILYWDGSKVKEHISGVIMSPEIMPIWRYVLEKKIPKTIISFCYQNNRIEDW